MKILIALNENKGENSKLSEHFGHCPYFAIYDTDTKDLEIFENKLEHSNSNITPVDQIIKFQPDIVFTLGMGKKAIELFNEKKIKIKTGNYKILKEVIDNFKNLEKLNEECEY